MLTVITGWSPKGYVEYGRRFAETFDRFWPKDVQLVVYGEEPVKLPRGEFRRLDVIPGCMEFLRRHDNAVARGQEPREDLRAKWKPKWLAQRYAFRFDAWKFCRQGFIPYHAAATIIEQLVTSQSTSEERQLLCWLDGDVVTHSPVPRGVIEGLLPPRKAVAYLGRGEKHSEIGFQLYDLDLAVRMLRQFREYYASDEVFTLKEWHSAYVFDTARRRALPPEQWHDLTPGGQGHVWHQSPLRAFTDHLKGNRKAKGRSHERRN